MATIYKRNKIWYIHYIYNGKRIRKSVGKSKRIAELALNDIELKLAQDHSGLFTKEITISKFFSEYENYIKVNLRPRTATRYFGTVKLLKDFLSHNSAITRLSHVSPALLEKYKAWRSPQVKNATVNMELKVFKTMFNLAIKWNYLKTNPIKSVSFMPNINRKIPRFYTEREINIILNAAQQPYKDIFQVLLYSGMRRDEARFLQVSDIDFTQNRIIIKVKDIFTPKTAERTIPIHKNILSVLKRNITGKKTSDLVFPNRAGKPYEPRKWWKILCRIAKETNIPNATIHTFRHTCASWLVMSGVDLRTVQRILGHSDIKTTLIYSHLAEEHLDKSINKISFHLPQK